jgi:hypothetical protein
MIALYIGLFNCCYTIFNYLNGDKYACYPYDAS